MQVSAQPVAAAAQRIEQRASVAQQILRELGNQLPVESFNDDDWYEHVTETGEFVRSYSGKTWNRYSLPAVPAGHSITRGLSAKHLMLWRA